MKEISNYQAFLDGSPHQKAHQEDCYQKNDKERNHYLNGFCEGCDPQITTALALPAAQPTRVAAIDRAAGQHVNSTFQPAAGRAVLVDAAAAVSARNRCHTTFQLDAHFHIDTNQD